MPLTKLSVTCARGVRVEVDDEVPDVLGVGDGRAVEVVASAADLVVAAGELADAVLELQHLVYGND